MNLENITLSITHQTEGQISHGLITWRFFSKVDFIEKDNRAMVTRDWREERKGMSSCWSAVQLHIGQQHHSTGWCLGPNPRIPPSLLPDHGHNVTSCLTSPLAFPHLSKSSPFKYETQINIPSTSGQVFCQSNESHLLHEETLSFVQ